MLLTPLIVPPPPLLAELAANRFLPRVAVEPGKTCRAKAGLLKLLVWLATMLLLRVNVELLRTSMACPCRLNVPVVKMLLAKVVWLTVTVAPLISRPAPALPEGDSLAPGPKPRRLSATKLLR